MNRIFKVIWSKTKNCYVVASELAKGRTKAASTGDKAKRLALAAITALMLLPVGGYSYAADTTTVKPAGTGSTTVVEVYTKEGTDKQIEAANKYTYRKAAELNKKLTDQKTSTALHISSSGDLIVGTKENYTVKDMEIRGKLTSGSISTGGITSTGDVTVAGKMAADGVTDETTKDGTYVKQNNTVGNNLVSLDKQVKANDDRITNVKEYLEQQTSDKYVSKADAAVQDGAIVKSANTIGENVTNLDAALAKETAARIGADKAQDAVIQQVNQNAANGIATLATAYNNEVASREAADTAINNKLAQDKTDTALHVTKDGNLIVGTKENQTVKDVKIRGQLTSGSVSTGNITATGDAKVAGKVEAEAVYDDTTKPGNYVVQTNSVGSNLSVLDTQVKANADAVATKANAADVYTKTETDSKVDAVKKEATTYTYRKVAAEEAARKAADNELNERITNEANAIHDEIKAGDTALDNRITAVKESLQQEAADTYVSKADAAVQDGAIVKADKTIGENVTNLDAALAKETADRLGADKAQDKVIQQVNQNMVDGFNTINKNMADGFTALNNADLKEAQERAAADTVLDDKITAETSARVVADTKLVEAVNSGLSLSDDNVLQKNTTTIDAQGNVTTSKTDANEMILNKGKDNQITLNEKGIKVGTNSTVVDKDGVYTGGDTYSEAKAAMSADGKIKGANGAFTVDENGNVTSKATITGETVTDGKGASMSNGTVTGKTLTDGIATITNGNINTSGTITGGTVTSTGNISAVGDIHAGGAITGASASIQGALTAGSATITGDLTAGGAIQGKSISDGTATMQNGNLTGVKNLSAETITTSGDATIGGDLTVNGKLNVDEIDLTKNGIVGDNNVTASTKVAAGEITSYKNATSTKDGSEKESAIDYDENGTSTWAKSTDADSNWNKSTLTVEGNDVTSKVIDSEKNSNLATQTSIQSQSTLTDADKNTNTATQSAAESSSVLSDKDGNNTSSFRQRIDQILQEIKSANGSTSVEQNDVNITNTAANGTITNDAKALVNKASDSITSQIGDGSAVKSVMDANGIANTAIGGTISNSAANISNTTTGNMTNTVGGNLIDTIMGTSTTTVTGKVTEDYKSDLSTKVGGDETHAVTGNQTTTVSGNRTVNVKGTETENFNALETNVKTDQRTSVGGNQTNIIAGNQQNTVSGSKTETVKGSVTEKYGSQATTVDGDQSTHVGGNQENVVTGNQTNTISGSKTETVKGAVSETYGSQNTKVNGNQSTTVTGKQTNSITGDQVNTIGGSQTTTVTGDVTEDYKANLSTTVGGSQTTTVTGDSSLTAENINNTANNKITNKAIDVETAASSSIVSKVSNDAGSNTSTQLSYQTKEEMSQADGKTASYLRGAAEEKSQLTDGDKKTTIDTVAGQTNTNITDGTNTSNSLQKADQVASSVTDGTNTTVVNQDAKSLASSITDGTKANNTNNTVDKSEQLIKANDTQYSATTKTATKMEDALVSGSNIIDVIKGLDAAGNPLISSAVTDGTTITGISQNAKDINLSAAGGTITNDAQNITNKAAETLSNSAKNIANTTTEDMTNTIGKNLKTTVGGDMSTEVTGSQSTTVKGNQSNTVEGTLTETVTGKATENYNGGLETTITGEEKHTVNGDQTNTITGKQTTTVTGDSSLSAKNITNKASEKITSQIGNDGKVKSEMTADGITNTAEGGTIYNKSKDILNEASGDILNFADGEIGNVATKITNITGDTTVTSDTNGTTFENKAHNTAIKEGTVTKTTISGNTLTTGQATMDYAEVMKDLGVHGNATVDQKLTVKGDSDLQGNANVGKNLTVNGTSDLKGNVTMESNATVQKDLTVNGTTTTNKLVVNNGATIKGGTTTDTLHVTSSSTFDGAATFKDVVTMEKDLSVGGNATVAGDVTAKSYKVGDKTYISESGINANNQKVVNVAAGDLSANSTDAVNGAQLYQTNERVTSVENRVGTVENRVDKLDSRVDKVGANAAALANLHPLEFDADSKWNIAAAVGGYKGETATAIGAFYRPNENVMVNVSSSFGTGENMYGGGISLRIGQGGNKARRNATNGLTEREKAMQKQIDSLTSRLDALLSVINPNMSKDFPDVPENHWAYEAVSRLAGNGVIQGYEDGKYHGDRTMTRYEMAEIIYNALSKGAKAEKKLVEEFKPELQAMAAQKKA
ncbi:ESPR-type extended signal peptide-containing protein [Megasphaera elsdenii]|uniref:ESPR-type extended signal peptide-containing protein n=1 Tax=Megasphaera elsdenii TaxID=907 RepID=UPI00091A64A9|nr:ESPR-type extended signal peptide-containing protein [Megasphaera elsdenii]SHK19923.1 Coiled stalk of trimeric autotransporter adhesin [Megasphaera elsdenii]